MATLSQDQGTTEVGKKLADFPDGLDAQTVIEFSKARNTAWDTYFLPLFNRIRDNRKMWRTLNKNPWRAVGNVPIPLPAGYAIVESVLARLNSTLLMRPKFAEAVCDDVVAAGPQGPGNEPQQDVEDFTNQRVVAESRQPEKGKRAIKRACLDGITICKSEWVREVVADERLDYQKLPTTGEAVMMKSESKETMREYWTFTPKNIANIAWDFHIDTRIQDASWVRDRSWMSYNELLVKEQNGEIENVEQLKNIVPSGVQGDARKDYENELKKASGDSKWRTRVQDEKLYQIDEWHALLTYTDKSQTDEDGNPVSTTKTIRAKYFVAENDYVLCFHKNDLKYGRHPYGSAQAIQDTENIIGLAILESIRPLLDSANSYAGKMQALVEWCSNPTIFYDDKSGLSGRTSFSRPLGMVPVHDSTHIKEFLANPESISVIQKYIQFILDMARESSGANEQFQGIEGADTATEFQGLQAAAGSRFADIADNLNQGLLEWLCYECFCMYAQFGVDGQMVVHRLSEEIPARALTKQDLQGEYHFVASTAAGENYKVHQVQDDTAFLQMVQQMNASGQFAPLKYNIQKHIEEISLALRGQKSSKDMFTPMPRPVPAPPPQPAPAIPVRVVGGPGPGAPAPGPGGPAAGPKPMPGPVPAMAGA